MNQITRNFAWKTLKFLGFWALVFALLYVIGKFIHLFIPFILAFIMAATISPLKRLLIKRFGFPSGIAVITAMTVELGGLGYLIYLLFIKLVRELQDIYLHWPYYNSLLQDFFSIWLVQIETVYLQLPSNYTDAINGTVTKLLNSIPGILSHGLSVAITIPEAIIVIVIALVATYFMSNGSERYINEFIRIFPFQWRESLKELGRDFTRAFSGFIKAEFLIFIITLIMSIGGLVIFKAKYAIILGTITGIFGILPVLGVGIVLVPWAGIAFLLGQNVLAVELLLLTAVVSVMRHVIEPKILGDNVGLDPLFVLISMYIGLATTGAIGLILGPFILIAHKALQRAGVFSNL
ncbi:MAG: sporulation integral membrane protein YtvI [Desulfitobacterium hafniense]|nr:sporulation integral membrane protein YtvI [Desulfitobacterium hafniense]